MIRTAIAALLLSSSVGFAASLEDCGPEASIGFSVDSGISADDKIGSATSTYNQNEWDDTVSFEIGLTWIIGKRKKCEEYNQEVINEQRATAKQEVNDALEQKVELCSAFEYATAPRSIRKFCGDLLIGE